MESHPNTFLSSFRAPSSRLPENQPKISGKWPLLANVFWLRIGWNKNFIMELAYGDKNLFCKFFLFIIEKFDFPVKMPPEKKVLWIYSFGCEWNIFILQFLDNLGYTLFKKYCVLPRHFMLELLPFSRPVYGARTHFRSFHNSQSYTLVSQIRVQKIIRVEFWQKLKNRAGPNKRAGWNFAQNTNNKRLYLLFER